MDQNRSHDDNILSQVSKKVKISDIGNVLNANAVGYNNKYPVTGLLEMEFDLYM